MGLLAVAKAKAKASTSTSASTSTTATTTGSDMGLLVVFFPQHNNSDNASSPNAKTNLNFPAPSSSFKRTNSNNLILSKTQSTISICALLLFLTLLLFTLSSFEPNTTTNPRRKPPTATTTTKNTQTQPETPKNNNNNNNNNWLFPKKLWPNKPLNLEHFPSNSKALQRMGTLYRRGTRAMTDLVVCHVADETTVHEFRLFLRLIHRSGLTARSDVVFLFASSALSSSFGQVIRQENDAFISLVELHSELNSTRWRQSPESSFDLTRFFVRVGKKGEQNAEPLWGRRMSRGNSSDGGESLLSYGSVLSFDAAELDPENSLAGFLDRVPLSLRRWACYPMLLGRVKRNFKHVMLVDVKNAVVIGDPLGRVRNRSSESVLLFERHHGRRNSESATRSTQRLVNLAVVMGGSRGVRRLANAVLVEIVRAAMQQQQRKRKNSVSESAVLSRLASSEFVLKGKGVELVDSGESIPEASQLGLRNYSIIQRGTTNHDLVNCVLKKQICSSVVDSSVYRDC